MSAFDIAIQAYDLAEERYGEFSLFFHELYDQYKGPNGLIREDIRLSTGYRANKAKLDKLNKHCQKICQFLNKNFKKEFRAFQIERRDARRAAILAKNAE